MVAALKVTHPHAPVTFLFCHAIELYLKAYLRAKGKAVEQLKSLSHRVADLASDAAELGLSLSDDSKEILAHVEDADVAIEARYIVTGFKQQPPNEALSTIARHLDEAICDALMKLGLNVRADTFPVPEPVRPTELSEIEEDVLRFLFQVKPEQREVALLAKALEMSTSLLQYHLDRLYEADLAEIVSSNYMTGAIFMSLTAKGRRYVVERKLHER